ncbi:MAG: chemotaxis response regulator protein-glutamate methylesterase [Gammaproteobacteria bacterium]|nr:chemotaxis response regulator protein-glutamate methylesterase [Gammaproteobacteria bacterium]
MTLRVLVVDDSRFFRNRVTDMLNSDPRLEVVAVAENGSEAIKKVSEEHPDVITMDIEMPVMDGITAVRKIMASKPVPILMFSSLTTDGAQATFDALEAGAIDYLPKNFAEISRKSEDVIKMLCDRVFSIASKGRVRTNIRKDTPISKPAQVAKSPPIFAKKTSYELVAIGCSTGGPVALQEVLQKIPGDFPLPIILVQHMPGTFTPSYAKRLDGLCGLTITEAKQGDILQPGTAYLAPGGKQLTVRRSSTNQITLNIKEPKPEENYRPCVDITFNSLASELKNPVLAIILTGMGADGREGARSLKTAGSTIWAQDEISSVVYGMPAAVADAGLTDRILPLVDIGPSIIGQV